MRLATWNVNSLAARLPRVTEWIGLHQPDVLCLQETKQADDKFPIAEFAELGYESAHHGDGRWNGVALLSRVGFERRGARLRHRRRRARVPHRRRHLWRRAGALGLRAQRPQPRQRVLPASSWPGWPGCAPCSTRRASRATRWRSAATSMWRPTTRTCGTRPHFVGATHVSEPERERPAARSRTGDCDDVFPRFNEPGDLHLVGLPGRRLPPGPRACASTWSWSATTLAGQGIRCVPRPRRPQGLEAFGPRARGGRLVDA